MYEVRMSTSVSVLTFEQLNALTALVKSLHTET